MKINVILYEMEKKLAGYKRQDAKHEIYSKPHFVSAEEVEALRNASSKCTYCGEVMTAAGKRDMKQWTLDRIDNRYGHNSGNVVLACLACNLQRKNRSVSAFKFTKQLIVVKLP
jgi:hypothetical protein